MNNKIMFKIMFIIMFSGIWVIVGSIFFIIGIVMLQNKKKKQINCTSKTYGKIKDIVRHESYNSNDGGYTYTWHPIFEYNIGELKFIKESSYGSSKSKYAIGQEIEVYYNPKDYNDYYIAGENTSKILGIIFFIVGVIAINIALFSTIITLNS